MKLEDRDFKFGMIIVVAMVIIAILVVVVNQDWEEINRGKLDIYLGEMDCRSEIIKGQMCIICMIGDGRDTTILMECKTMEPSKLKSP